MREHLHSAEARRMLEHMREHVTRLTGREDAAAGFQIAGLIHILANQYDNYFARESGEDELSGPRIGLLVRLYSEEMHGNHEGVTPTALSVNQHVSRNTISALLRGLEDQGMIERSLDPTDRRLFRIRLTEAGRSAVITLGPQRVEMVNRVVAVLSPEERAQLIALLSKLFESLCTYCQPYGKESEK